MYDFAQLSAPRVIATAVDRSAYWCSRALCTLRGHRWVPNGGSRVCVRIACRGRTVEKRRA